MTLYTEDYVVQYPDLEPVGKCSVTADGKHVWANKSIWPIPWNKCTAFKQTHSQKSGIHGYV